LISWPAIQKAFGACVERHVAERAGLRLRPTVCVLSRQHAQPERLTEDRRLVSHDLRGREESILAVPGLRVLRCNADLLRMQSLAYIHDFDGTITFADKWLKIVGDRGKESSAFHYWKGIGLMGKRRPAEAEEAFTASLAGQGRPVWQAAALLKRGCARDIQGRRSDAILDYQAMKKANDPWLEADRAAIYLKRPFTWEDFPREISPRGF